MLSFVFMRFLRQISCCDELIGFAYTNSDAKKNRTVRVGWFFGGMAV